jgi:hypothetical protein
MEDVLTDDNSLSDFEGIRRRLSDISDREKAILGHSRTVRLFVSL